ncbi:MAG: HAD-IC family P-type ATPase, partial [Thermomicrobiales bacterium]
QIDTEARVFNVVKTPLQREIIWLMRGLLVVILLLTLLVLGTFNRVSGTFPFDQIMMEDASRATAVLVGLIPQGLVLMITVTYAMSILRLARKNALVQHMNAAESLSHVDVLCLDKTGTITTNELSLHALTPLGIDQLDLQRALGDFVASSASMNRTASAIAASFPGSVRRLRHEAPFDSDRKWSALSFADDIDQKTYVLGAPEVLLPFLRADTRYDDRRVDEWTSQGLRVLLFAAGADATAIADPLVPHLPVDLFPLGLIALRDELRADARETIDHFVQAGISLKLISGDHVNTVTTLARQAGIAVNADDQIVSGWQLEGLSDDEYEEIAQRGVIFGRVTPQQKERLVSALRRRDHYVAMIGDGVNDVPALKHAQVAIAMRSGTAVTRSISDVILLDDSFAALPDAFMEGQRIRNGLETTIDLFLTRTIYTMLIVWATATGGGEFPVAFRHSALIGLLAVGIPAFALAIWAKPGNVERRVLPAVLDVVVPAALTISLAGFAIYQTFLRLFDIAVAQSALTALTITCSLLLIPFLRPPTGFWVGAAPLSRDWRPAMFASLMFLLYLVVVFIPPLQMFYEIEPLPLLAYPMIAAFVLAWVLLVRWIWRHGVMTIVHSGVSRTWERIVSRTRLRSRTVPAHRRSEAPSRH